jgi:hypothetical protein
MKRTMNLYLQFGIAVLGLLLSTAAHTQLTYITDNGTIAITGYCNRLVVIFALFG